MASSIKALNSSALFGKGSPFICRLKGLKLKYAQLAFGLGVVGVERAMYSFASSLYGQP